MNMFNRSVVLQTVEDRMQLYRWIDDACIEINDMQERYVFGSSDILEKELANYHYWSEKMENAGWLRLVDDFSIPAQYIDISVPTRELSDLILSVLKKHVPILTVQELKENARRARDDPEKASAYAHLGLGAQGEYDKEVQEILEFALLNESAKIRTSATLSIFLLKWPQFRSALERAIVAEEDMDLRAKMAHALAFCVAAQQPSSG